MNTNPSCWFNVGEANQTAQHGQVVDRVLQIFPQQDVVFQYGQGALRSNHRKTQGH